MSQNLIFISGTTGFIGAQVASAALANGYRVRLSVRRESQIQTLQTRYASHAKQLDIVVVPDISSVEALKVALDGVSYVIHVASPMPGKASDLKTGYIDPSVKGTVSVLDAALAVPSIKRVILESSILALIPVGALRNPGVVAREGAGASITVDLNMPLPEGFAGEGVKYQISKVLSHQATLEWQAGHKPHFSLITFHPSFVLGPDLTQTDAKPGGMNAMLMKSLIDGTPYIPSAMVDVRDLAEAHIKALEAPVPVDGNVTELIINGPKINWGDIAKFVKEKYPSFPTKLDGQFPEALEGSASRAERLLGMNWRSLDQMVGSVIDQQLSYAAAKAGL